MAKRVWTKLSHLFYKNNWCGSTDTQVNTQSHPEYLQITNQQSDFLSPFLLWIGKFIFLWVPTTISVFQSWVSLIHADAYQSTLLWVHHGNADPWRSRGRSWCSGWWRRGNCWLPWRSCKPCWCGTSSTAFRSTGRCWGRCRSRTQTRCSSTWTSSVGSRNPSSARSPMTRCMPGWCLKTDDGPSLLLDRIQSNNWRPESRWRELPWLLRTRAKVGRNWGRNCIVPVTHRCDEVGR